MVPPVLFALLLALAIARSPAETRAAGHVLRASGEALMTSQHGRLAGADRRVRAGPPMAHSGAAMAGAIGFYVLAYPRRVSSSPRSCTRSSGSRWHPVARFARSSLQLIAFSTSSSIASLPALVRAPRCWRSRPARAGCAAAGDGHVRSPPVSWTVGALFVGWFYGVPLHASQLATIAFAAVFRLAAPGIPRRAMLTPLLVTGPARRRRACSSRWTPSRTPSRRC
jgi:hypothetical protein